MFDIFLTPLGRYLFIAAVVFISLGGIYLKIRSDAIAEIELKATADALRRTQDAIRAGDAVDISPDRVRDSDGHKRD